MPSDFEAQNVVDLQAALERVEGDRDLLESLIAMFVKQLSATGDRLERMLAGRDFAGLKRAAHSLRGSAATFSAVEAMETAQVLERMAAAEDADGASVALAAVKSALSRLQPALEASYRR